MIERPDVSVVICTYTEHRWPELHQAVESARRQSHAAREVIVVVDHNAKLLKRVHAEIRNVVAVPNSGVRGLAGARNSGTSMARSPVVAFLDDDAIADHDWLASLSAPYASPDVLGVGGRIDPLWVVGTRPACFPSEFDWVVGCTYRGMPEHAGFVRNVIGANMSFRLDVLVATGGFRVGMGRVGSRPVGCEETELCIRAGQQFHGGRFMFEPRARVLHRVPAERAGWRYFRDRCVAEGYSKALVTRCVGTSDGLSSERHYVLRTLPAGVARGMGDALRRGDPSGLGRGTAIAAGLALTSAGYLAGVLAQRLPTSRPLAVSTTSTVLQEES